MAREETGELPVERRLDHESGEARADTYEDRIHTYGVRCTSCGFTGAEFELPNSGGLAGHLIQSGDKLYWNQYQVSGAHGGIAMWFSDGSFFTGAVDQDGNPSGVDATQGSWHYRRVDLSQFAGKTIDHWTFNTDTSTSPGSWNIYYQDVAMFSADGTVRPIYNRQKTISLSVNAYPGMTGVGYEVNHWTLNGSGGGVSWLTTTNYYHGDHLGSSRQMTTVNGYPTLSATFLPFGQEWNPQITVNNYKFTGNERDAESQLDHTWFRQYSSSLARWASPDPLAGSIGNPQSLNRYAYVDDDPTDLIDPLGLFTIGPCGVDGSLCPGGPTYPVPGQCYDLLLDGISIGNTCNIIGPGPILRRRPGGSTMSAAPGPPGPTIGPNTDGFNSKRAMCAGQAANAVGKDLIFFDEFNAVADSIATGSLSPLGALFSAGTGVTAVEQTADYVAGNRAVQTATRGFLRSQSVRVSANAIGKRAALIGKGAAALGLVLTGKTVYDAYNACMSN